MRADPGRRDHVNSGSGDSWTTADDFDDDDDSDNEDHIYENPVNSECCNTGFKRLVRIF